MDLHVILTIGQYAYKRMLSGWFLYLFGGAALLLVGWLLQGGSDPQEALLSHRADALDLVPLAAMLLVTMMGATEIPRDIETRTIMIVLSKPLTKADYVLGKFAGFVFVSAFTVGVLGAVCVLGCLAQGLLDPKIVRGLYADGFVLQSLGFGFWRAVLVAAVVTLLSTRLNEIPIIFFTAMYAALAFLIVNLQVFLMDPSFPSGLKIVLSVLYYGVPNFRFLQIPPENPLLGMVPWSHFFWGAAYSIAYAGVLLLLSIRSFERRQVAG